MVFSPWAGRWRDRSKPRNMALVQAFREALGDITRSWSMLSWGGTLLIPPRCCKPWSRTTCPGSKSPFPPEHGGTFSRLKTDSAVPLATGEHVYTRWQVKELLEVQAVDWVQTDPDWCGGISELVKICALASSFDVPVAAHGHSLLAALHVAGSQSPSVVPYVEYLIQHQAAKQHFHKPFYQPQNGEIALPELPGLGLVLDEEKIECRIAL